MLIAADLVCVSRCGEMLLLLLILCRIADCRTDASLAASVVMVSVPVVSGPVCGEVVWVASVATVSGVGVTGPLILSGVPVTAGAVVASSPSEC